MGKSIAIIFDPNIEEALLYKVATKSTHSKDIKSKEAHKILSKILEKGKGKELVELISTKLCEAMTKRPKHQHD